jgi:GT2 family glycosyltransferase
MHVTLSIVSHGHSDVLRGLLADLNAYSGAHILDLIITLNAPELETATELELKQLCKFKLTVLKNSSTKGFAANHNLALVHASEGVWCVINPDIRLDVAHLDSLMASVTPKYVGLAHPRQQSPSGQKLEYARALVTPLSLLKRYVGSHLDQPNKPDWVSGCFMAFRSEVYQELGGFDEKYFLYCEDVDICLRLQLAGYKMVEADFSIVHDTRRGTLKKFDHFKWHVSSLLKLWCSGVFWAYLSNRHRIKA